MANNAGSSGKQCTLFQTWGANKSQAKKLPNQPIAGPSKISSQKGFIELSDDEDDALLAMVMEESLRQLNEQSTAPAKKTNKTTAPLFRQVGNKSTASSTATKQSCSDSANRLEENVLNTVPNATAIEDLPGFDNSAGDTWVYPTNYPVRDYQYNIVETALYKNTLVTLPTGLGKTFIAAVAMYNFYRWYPLGKIVFMAPTKPLVAQQIEACYNIMGIPQSDTAEMTGAMPPPERVNAWRNKRVFFLTPQVMTNDLSRGAFPANDIKCLVIDEAHKATGNHAYCQVVRELGKYDRNFRVLALSATPGSDIKAVQQVIENLHISVIELRTEDSIDIQPYSHERKVEKVVVPLGDELSEVKAKYIELLTVRVNKLKQMRVVYNRDVTSLSKFLLLKSREAFRQNPPPNLQQHQYGIVEGEFALLISLYHGFELLQLHGSRSLYKYLNGLVSGEKGNGRTRTQLLQNDYFNSVMQLLHTKFEPQMTANGSFSATQSKPFVISHPKLDKLQEIVVDHFTKFQEVHGNTDTRIMIFSQYRESVTEIRDMLNLKKPLVRVMSFIGQSSVGKAAKGFTQKEQLRVMKEFREGGFNTLVSTCVGEEGLDIGDVDLIICFDAHKSPIRLVQRMGRTGRKRQGRIVMLVTEGKEESVYNQSVSSKKSIHKAILNGTKSLRFYEYNKRMIPLGLNPVSLKLHITVKNKFVAKNNTKKNTTGTAAQKKISLTSGNKAGKCDGFLTEEELQKWNDKYRDRNSVPTLPGHTAFISLSKNKDRPQVTADSFGVMDLSKWTPWQNQLQATSFVDHSVETKNLVEIMEFMEIQSCIPNGEDSYGMEMSANLNKADVLEPGQKDDLGEGIDRFCTTVQKESAKSKDTGQKTSRKKKRKKKGAVLPEFSSNEDENNDSDADLPPAFEISKVLKNKHEVICLDDEPMEADDIDEVEIIDVDLAHAEVHKHSISEMKKSPPEKHRISSTVKPSFSEGKESLTQKHRISDVNKSSVEKLFESKESSPQKPCISVQGKSSPEKSKIISLQGKRKSKLNKGSNKEVFGGKKNNTEW